jgi:hypothetical protein
MNHRTLVAVVVALLGAGFARANTITVNSTSSAYSATIGECTLKTAISVANAANGYSPSSAPPSAALPDGIIPPSYCAAAGAGSNTIVLPQNATFTFDVSDNDDFLLGGPTTLEYGLNGLPKIGSTIVIQGNGSTITRPGGGCGAVDDYSLFRFFDVDGGAAAALELDDLTLQNGCPGLISSHQAGQANYVLGGAILSRAPLTLRRVHLLSNQLNYAETGYYLTITDMCGGAVAQVGSGDLLIEDSTFEFNSTDYAGGHGSGGGLCLGTPSQNASLRRVYFGNNIVGLDGGAIRTASIGNLEIVNATFYFNAAGHAGGALALEAFGSAVTISYSTIADNNGLEAGPIAGAGIYLSSGSLTLAHDVLANGYADGSCHVVNGSTTVAFAGQSVATDSTCGGGIAVIVTTPSGLQLSDPADNGGPVLTMAIGAHSPALDLVSGDGGCVLPDLSVLATDARGKPRPVNQTNWYPPISPRCDAGAFESDDRPFANGFAPGDSL